MSPWGAELWRLAGALAAGAAGGLAVGRPWFGLWMTTMALLAWHLWRGALFQRWLARGSGRLAREPGGLWGELYDRVLALRRRQQQRKRLLTAYLSRFRELTDALPDGAVVVRREGGEIQWFNEAARRLLGLKAQDLGQRLDNLVRHPAFLACFRAAGPGGSAVLPAPVDGRRLLEATVVPYGTDLALVVFRDVTRIHRLERMRKDFVANISHELKTPITVLAGYLETLAEDDDGCARRWGGPLRQMREQVGRMQRIVEDLLLLSRLETDPSPPSEREVDVPALVRELVEEARALSGGRHAFSVEIQEGLHLRGSAAELRSAFANLLSNAVRYTPAGGRIAVRWRAEAEGARFEVEDTGPGIPAQHLPRLTERFYRVDVGRSRDTGGTGLGLAIVKHVLERHGARLEIWSEPGKGSRFACCFPCQEG